MQDTGGGGARDERTYRDALETGGGGAKGGGGKGKGGRDGAGAGAGRGQDQDQHSTNNTNNSSYNTAANTTYHSNDDDNNDAGPIDLTAELKQWEEKAADLEVAFKAASAAVKERSSS